MNQPRRNVGTVQGFALRNPVGAEVPSATVGYPTWYPISSGSASPFFSPIIVYSTYENSQITSSVFLGRKRGKTRSEKKAIFCDKPAFG